MENNILIIILTLIATGVFVVSVFKKLKLSPVLGYLVAGAILGDHSLNIVNYSQVSAIGEFGVVFLLFAIGLELSFERLKAMRRYVFGLGSMQLVITALLLILICTILFSIDNNAAIIISGGLALSSTAIVLQVISETNNKSTQIGRIAIAILLLQDFAVVPLLVLVNIFGGDNIESLGYVMTMSLFKAIGVLLVILFLGRVLLRPLFSFISQESSEIGIAFTLLVVLGAAWSTEHFGLSLALGAFVSGVIVAETDFKWVAEESIYPFKSLLLGLFFMSVGMQIDVQEIYAQINLIFGLCIALITLKAIIIAGLCRLFGFNKGVAIHAGLLLSQGGEFAFILFGLGKDNGVLAENTANILLLVVTCSMALTPLLGFIGQKIAERIETRLGKTPLQIIEYGARDIANHIIIIGFGKVGKMIGKVLRYEGINYLALDIDEDSVQSGLEKGLPVFKGDGTNINTLNAMGIKRATTLVITINNEITAKKLVKLIRKNFVDLDIIVRTKDVSKMHAFYEAGATTIIPQYQEIGLQLGTAVLYSIGVNDTEVKRIMHDFRSDNYSIVYDTKEDS